MGWLWLGLGWIWVGFAWVGLTLCWVGFGLGLLWVVLALALVVLALGWVCFGFGWVGFGLGWVGLGWVLGWVSFGLYLFWLVLAWVGFGLALDVCNSSLSFNFFETNLMHFSAPWMGGRQLQHQLRTFLKYHYVCLGVLYVGQATPAIALNFLKSTYALCHDFCNILI